MKSLLTKVGHYLLIGIFIFGFIMCYAGLGRNKHGPNHFNSAFIIIGLVIMFPYIAYFIKIFYFDKRKYNLKQKNTIDELKRKGIKLPVNLEVLKINKTRKSYNSQVINNTTRSGALNQLTGNPEKNIRTTEFNDNEVKFKVPYGNNFIKFTKSIDMEPTTLMLHFAVKKETYLYVNPANINDYYLDLEFLNQ